MARHSEDECAYCGQDLLPLSYLIGSDQNLYCSAKCADKGEQPLATQEFPPPEKQSLAQPDLSMN